MKAQLIALLFVITCSLAFPQNASITDIHNIFDEKGDYYFEKKDYKKAIVYYNMAYKKDANNYYSVLKKAEAFNALGHYDQAAECYRIVFSSNLHITNDHRLDYALLLLKNKNIPAFEDWMSKYNEIVYEEIHHYVSSTEVRAKMYRDSSMVIVENESSLNTAEQEIAPAVHGNKVLFASARKNLAGTNGSGNFDYFAASFGVGGHLGRINRYNADLNSSLNESSITISGNNLYVSRSTLLNSKLKTFIANVPSTLLDALQVRELLLEGFSSIGHVVFNSKGTKMYFVSEAPGGSGGLDIYSSDLVAGKWAKPVNLSAVNTLKDETYPCLVGDTVLYFSSSGHNSLGGFDLFSINLTKPDDKVKNLGNRVNTPYDDYALTFSPSGLTGYFCSNRPGGFGKEDIYRLHLLDLKIKLEAYKFKKKSTIEPGKINLYLSDGEEYNIMSADKAGFDFTFIPGEAYKMVIQHENVAGINILDNTKLNEDQKAKEILAPKPLERTEIRLQTGQKYQFTAGMKPISEANKNAVIELAKTYSGSGGSSTIDLTALAKELLLESGEIYSIQFMKDDNIPSKSKAESNLNVNNTAVPVGSRSFFIILPLDIQTNFNILTDVSHFRETFNPNKAGPVKVDATPVYKKEKIIESEGFPILVNTELFNEITMDKNVPATELSIVPGTMYILTFGKEGSKADEQVVVPLTKGVKYNLGTTGQSAVEYNKAVTQLMAGQPASSTNEELIDISILSKELNMRQGDVVFKLIPARQFSSQSNTAQNVLTTLSVNGRKYFVTNKVKMQVNLKLEQNKKVNLQTDLAYVKDNFDPSTISLKVDTSSVRTNITQKTSSVITDPVFDMIVINFSSGEYILTSEAKNILEDKVTNVLKDDKRLYVTIKGYTDPIGDVAYNERLSKNRAHAVKDFLAMNGIGEDRIRTFSFGASQALKEGESWEKLSDAELAKHRKVEIIIYLPK